MKSQYLLNLLLTLSLLIVASFSPTLAGTGSRAVARTAPTAVQALAQDDSAALQDDLPLQERVPASIEAPNAETAPRRGPQGANSPVIQALPGGWTTVDNAGTGNVWNDSGSLGAVNHTTGVGGSGASAAADSEAVCNEAAWDTELWSPSIDLSGSTTATLAYASNFQRFGSYGEIWLDISTNAGAGWTNLLHQTVSAPVTGTNEIVDLDAYVSNNVILRWRYSDNVHGCAFYWHIDDVLLRDDSGVILSEDFEPPPAPDLSGSYKMMQSEPLLGAEITYTVSINNSGDLAATGTVFQDPIPDGGAFARIVSGPASYNAAQDRIEWSGTVNAGQSTDFTFVIASPGDAACGASFTNTAVITAPGIPSTITLQTVAQMWELVHYYETWEDDDGGYSASGASVSWEWGAPTSGPGSAHSGDNVWATNLGGEYNISEVSYLTSPPIDLGSAPSVEGYQVWLQWWQWLDVESDYDLARVEARGGSVGWTTIYGPLDGPVDLEWAMQALDVSQFAGVDDFQVRFYLESDFIITYAGWYIDDVAIVQCAPPPGLYLSPSAIQTSGCNGVTQTHTFGLYNNTGADAVFDLDYTLDEPAAGAITGTTSLLVSDTLGVNLYVELEPILCLPDDLELRASVQASGNGYTATTRIAKSTFSGLLPEWLAAVDTLQGTRYHAVAYHDGYVYQIGGESNRWEPTGSVNRYDVANGVWMTVTDMLTPAYGIDAVTIGDSIYVPGGSDDGSDTFDGGTFLNALQVYSTTANAWSLGASLPVNLAYASAAAHDGKLYVIGGQQDSGVYTNTLYVYDPASDSWAQGASMSQARGYAAAAAVNGKLYVAGGFAGGDTTLGSLEIYDPASDTWSAGPAAPRRAAFFGDGALGDWLIAFNGDAIDQTRDYTEYGCSQNAYYFDTASDTWHDLPLLNRCYYGSQGVAVGKDFYLVSGRSEASPDYWVMATEVEYLQVCPFCTSLGWLEGHVYDYDAVSLVAAPATVHVQPGDLDVTVISSTGYYSLSLIPWDYAVSASALGYPRADGPYTLTVSEGLVAAQDFALDRPKVAVNPTYLDVAASAPGAASGYFTITNDGTFTLEYELREVPPPAPTLATARLSGGALDAAAGRSAGIQVEPELQASIQAADSTGYLIYFHEWADLSPALELSWQERGWFVMQALQDTARRSQARVRAYLEAQGADYQAFWIDNVIVVESSGRQTFDGLLAFSEIEALRARRQPILHEPEEVALDVLAPLAIEANLTHVNADDVWGLGYDGSGIVVANIDTGVRYTHQALEPRYRGALGGGAYDHNYNWWDPYANTLAPNDTDGHGSHTIGIMVGQDADRLNQIGMAPGAQWIACQGFDPVSTDAGLLECAQFMVAPWDLNGANPNPNLRPHVVNNSWSGCKTSFDPWYKGVVASWHAAGIYPIFSNGNASNCGYFYPPGLNTVGNPARYGNVTGVGSTGQSDGQYASHSNWGPTDDPDTINPRGYPALKPQVLAPGVNIRSAINSSDTDYGAMAGTSMSAPHVAGLIALMWQAAPCLLGEYAATETIIEQTAVPIPYASGNGDEGPGDVPNHAAGWGEIDALAAVEYAVEYCNTDWLPWVSANPISGTLAFDQAVQLDFTCSFTESQQSQPLQGALLVQHNDPTLEDVRVDLEFFCAGSEPNPVWDKELWINGQPASPLEGPHVVRSGDEIVVIDQVGGTFSGAVTSTLTETWDAPLELVSYDAAGVGTVLTGTNQLRWSLTGIAPNVYHPITKTFVVAYGAWNRTSLYESYYVEGASAQRHDVVIDFERYVPNLALQKSGPDVVSDGATVQMTLVISSDGAFRGNAVLTDALPGGMTYAGNLSATYGRAWEDGNVVYWSSLTGTVLPPPFTSLDVVADGGFEAGTPNAFWDEASTNFDTPLCTVADCGSSGGTGPHSGDWWAWFGNTFKYTEIASVDQDVTIIQGYPELSFWLDIPVADITGTLQVSLDGDVLFTASEADAGSYNPYTQVRLLVDDVYADGGLHNLRFESSNPAGADEISFFVDDVALEVYLLEFPMPDLITITFDVQVSGAGKICNLAELHWGADYTDYEHCVTASALSLPQAGWVKSVYVNGQLVSDVANPIPVLPGDAVEVVDQVDVAFTSDIAFVLEEKWSESLELQGYAALILPGGSSSVPGSAVISNTRALTWTVNGLPADWTYVISKTFQVLDGPWDVDVISESLYVSLADPQPDDVLLNFQHLASCQEVTGVSLSLVTPGELYPGQALSFSAVVAPNNANKPYTYTVDYDDGAAPITAASSADPLLLSHTYATSGVFDVALSVWNCAMLPGAAASATLPVEIAQAVYKVYLPLVLKTASSQ